MAENFDVNLNDEVENFVVEFGEIQRITVDDFDKLRNRPSYNSQLMTHETNIPKVPANVSELNNDSDYQTGEEVAQALEAKQDKLTAGNNVHISEQNVISATDTVYSAGNGINISPQNELSVDTTVVVTQQELSNEVHNRENADNYLQGQIDAISASSDVVDIVGTYADLQNYDTQHLKDNDIIKVLQDETQGNATTYYRWSTNTQTFTLIGQEGPYYTKAGADAQFVPQTRTVNGKALDSNIALNASDVSALGPDSVAQTTGSSTSKIMSQKATTDALDTKLNASDYVVDTQLANSDNPVQNRVLNGLLGDMPSDFFSGEATTTPTASTEVQFGNILSLDDAQLLGDTTQQTYSGKNLCALGTKTVDVYELFPLVKSLPAGTYTFSAQVTSTDTQSSVCFVRFINGNSGVGAARINRSDERTYITVTTTDNADGLYLYAGYNASDSAGDTAVYTDIQIEAGSTATPYEQYVGGVPAPNPDYPQSINVVTGTQNVWAHGKNLFDKSTVTLYYYIASDGTLTSETHWCVTDYINIKPETQYAYFGLTNPGIAPRAAYYDENKNLISTFQQAVGKNTITTPASAKYIRFSINLGSPYDVDAFQLELGSTATTYEPYQDANYIIDLGATELCKIGNYQDYIYNSGSDWYVHKEVYKITADGTQSITLHNTRNGVAGLRLAVPFDTKASTTVLSDKFLYVAWSEYQDNTARTMGKTTTTQTDYGSIYVTAPNSSITNANGMTTWFSNNNSLFYYVLATPTDTKITDATLISELEALLSASTYRGETDFVITATGTNLPAPLQLTAINANAKGLIERMRA